MDVDFAELSASWGNDGGVDLDLPAQFFLQQDDELMDAELMAFLTQPQPACIGLSLEPAVEPVRRTSSECSDSASVPASSVPAPMSASNTNTAAACGTAPRLVTTQVSCGPQSRKKAATKGSTASAGALPPSSLPILPPLPPCAQALASGAVASSAAGSPTASPINPPPASLINLISMHQSNNISTLNSNVNPFVSTVKSSVSPSASSLGSAPTGLHDMLQKLGAGVNNGAEQQTSSQNSAGTGATAATAATTAVAKKQQKAAQNDDSSSEDDSDEDMDEGETRHGVKRPATDAATSRANKRKVPDVDWRAITDPAERRRQRRLAKNRVTAARSRDRKKVQWAELEGRLQAIEGENSKLRSMLEAYANENTTLRAQINSLTGNSAGSTNPASATATPFSFLSGASHVAGSGNNSEPAVYVLIFTLLLVTCFLPGDEAALSALGAALPLLAAAVALAQSLDADMNGGGFGKGAGNGAALLDMMCRMAAMAQGLVARSGRAARKSMRRLLFGAGFSSRTGGAASFQNGGGSVGVDGYHASTPASAAVTAGLMDLDGDRGGGGGGVVGSSLCGSSSNLIGWVGSVAAHCIKCEVMI